MLNKEIPTSSAPQKGPSSINDASSYHPSPSAWEDQQLYFLLPDRFSNNSEDGSLDPSGKPVQGSIRAFKPDDAANAIKPPANAQDWVDSGVAWQGGDLQGIKSKLGYLKRLGVTAVWVGPIFKQVPSEKSSYHGYAIQDFLEIDPHFGTREDLRDLVKSAHEQGIYVILDIILNHSGNVFAYTGEQPGRDKPWTGQQYDVEGFRDSKGQPTLPYQPLDPNNLPKEARDCAIWPAELQGQDTFTREGAISNWDYWPEFLRGDFLSLKDIELGRDDPDVFAPTPALKTLCEVYKYWIAYADLDGYRIDTVKHMGDGPTRHLCTTLHEYACSIGKENFFLVGEVTGGRAFDTVEATGLDAALGIGNVQQNLWNLPKGNVDPTAYFDLFRNATFLKKGSHAWMRNKVVTMIDDHDQVWRGESKERFCFGQNGSELCLAALALNLTTLGIPCIYYGTEQQFDGQGNSDRYIRETMFGGSFGAFRSKDRHFFDEANTVFQEVAKITQLRNEYAALRRGRQYLREISGNGKDFGLPRKLGETMKSIVAWSRVFADQEVLCAINTDTENWTKAFVTIDDGLHAEGDKLKCSYRSPTDGDRTVADEVEVEGINGKAVELSVPPSGFVIYA
ncbi:glycoside hydrolase superfamily [Lophiotrema nucula]|uniref:Glycoside hydrolase superfamily n=1 Tax=Lophiotrema nucula TaxID=690887 RepID=A0A6A5ZQ50_9PLEO|nr:glycoside hydrolase superfamily [Lophiotrema nucula]